MAVYWAEPTSERQSDATGVTLAGRARKFAARRRSVVPSPPRILASPVSKRNLLWRTIIGWVICVHYGMMLLPAVNE